MIVRRVGKLYRWLWLGNWYDYGSTYQV